MIAARMDAVARSERREGIDSFMVSPVVGNSRLPKKSRILGTTLDVIKLECTLNQRKMLWKVPASTGGISAIPRLIGDSIRVVETGSSTVT